jgi:hypothetical protein
MRKKVRIVIQGTIDEALEQARKHALDLERRVREERKSIRTRGLVLMGVALAECMSEKEMYDLFEKLIDLDAVVKSGKKKMVEKHDAKNEATKAVIAVARTMNEIMKKRESSSKEKPDSATAGNRETAASNEKAEEKKAPDTTQ